MAELARRFLLTTVAGAVEAGTGLDDQFTDSHFTVDSTTGGDFQAFGRNAALELAADENPFGGDFAVDQTLLSDRDFPVGANIAFEAPVDMQTVAQGKVADQLCACCNDGRSGTLAVRRMTFANDSH